QAPAPPNTLPAVRYEPLFTRVRAGETHRRRATIALPVDEYSPLARDVEAPTLLEELSRVMLVLGHRARSTLEAEPLPPPFESPDDAGYIVHDPSLLVSSMDVHALPVKRRTGYIARFALPGEPDPEPMPEPPEPTPIS